MPDFGAFCLQKKYDEFQEVTPEKEAAKEVSNQLDEAFDAGSSPGLAQSLHRADRVTTPRSSCSHYKSHIRNNKRCNAASRSSKENQSLKVTATQCKQQGRKKPAGQQPAGRKQRQVSAEASYKSAVQPVEDACPSPGAGASSPTLSPVKQPALQALQAPHLQAQTEEKGKQALNQTAKGTVIASAQAQKAEVLKDLVKRLEGRAERVALDLRLEHASRELRSSRDGEAGSKAEGASPKNAQKPDEKLGNSPLPIEAPPPDKQLSGKSKSHAPNPANERSMPKDLGAGHKTQHSGIALSARPGFELDSPQAMLDSLFTKAKDATSMASGACSEDRNDCPSMSASAEKLSLTDPESRGMHCSSLDWGTQISHPSQGFSELLGEPKLKPDKVSRDSRRAYDLLQCNYQYPSSPGQRGGSQVIAIAHRLLCLTE